MSLSRPAWPAGPARPVPSTRPPEDPAATPPSSKRPRLEEPAGVSAAAWPLLVVPRLSEVEKVWEWSPRPFPAFLIPKNPGSSGGGRQQCGPGWQDRTFQTQSCWQSGVSGRTGCSRAPEKSQEPGLQEVREALGVRHDDPAEMSPVLPNTSKPGIQRVKPEPEELPAPGKGTTLKEKNSVRQPGSPFLDVTFSEETKPTLYDIKDRCKVVSVITSEKKENISSSTLKIPRLQNQACLGSAKPGYFRDNITIISPEFPRDLNSNMSFVYLKEIAKKKNDKVVAYARDFTNIFWSQNRPDAKKQKFQDDKKIVFVENDFCGYYESQQQSLPVEGEIDLISLNCCHRSSIEGDVRYSSKNSTLTLKDANWEGTERNLDCYLPTTQEESQSWDSNRAILKRKRQNSWIKKNFRVICGTVKKLTENSNLAQLLETDLLNKGDYHNAKVRDVHEPQSSTPVIGTLGTSPNLIKIVWFNGKDENANILQLKHYTMQKYISRNKDGSTLTCHQMLTCEKQIDIQKIGILSKFLQNNISELYNIILKTNIVSLLNHFVSFIRNGDDSEEGYIFKCLVHLNYLKNIIKESHVVYLTRIFISSRPLVNNTKSMAKKRKLFKMEHVLEGAQKHSIISLSIATKRFPIYKPHENVPLLLDFEDTEGLSLSKEPSYENASCSEQFLNVENWAYYSFGIASTHVKSDMLFIQNNCGHTSEKYYESGMSNQDLDIEKKQKQKTPHSIFQFVFEHIFNARQLSTLLNENKIHSDQINAMMITQKSNLENLLDDIEWKIYDFILKKYVKITESSSSFQVHKAIGIEKKEDNPPPIESESSVQVASRVSKDINVREIISANQNSGANTKETGDILQEGELANSARFHPENDSTLYADHQFESDSSGENNECFQGLADPCLPTETLPIAKDFEMKSKFDLVLEELRMFHEISKENEIPSTAEANNRKENYFGESNDVKEARMEIEKDLEMVETNKRNAPALPLDLKAGSNMHKRHQRLFNWKAIPTHGGQAVPNEYCCPRSEEESLHSTPEEDYKKPFHKSPAFSAEECKKEKNDYLLKGGSHLSHGISRVQPLKTCNRPIRVGLSRRARLKQLHPYLK
ncbi:RAD51-associated protein 2 isoform X1 [Chionomys nivalis]|uniref:RAD51-associated protein 2 isoform X1 n=1 Tax=Chionomys nivalis TaxID=269649 RepID=UPI002598F990|nr:RAD51-associated protein 2 isoform X1 [Chionomys nivalis]